MPESDSQKMTRELPKPGEWPCQTTPLQHPAPPRLVPFLYRLLRDGARVPGEVEEHLLQVRHHDGEGIDYTNQHILAYAEAIAAFLLTAASDGSSGVTAENAAVMTSRDFELFLGDLAQMIAEGDSMEGTLAYEWGDEPDTLKVNAAVRVGNASAGQGGVRLINQHTWPPSSG